jgi:hypothetical protein
MNSLGFIYPALLLAPLLIWWIRLRTTGWPLAAPPWLSGAVAALAVMDIAYVAVIERQFLREPMATKIRARGQTPEQSVALVGAVLLLAPVCWALLASFLGLSAGQFSWYAAASVAGLAIWGWRYRSVILSPPDKNL